MSLLFEDLFKRLNGDLKRQADMQLSKASRASAFDVARQIRAGALAAAWLPRERGLNRRGEWSRLLSLRLPI